MKIRRPWYVAALVALLSASALQAQPAPGYYTQIDRTDPGTLRTTLNARASSPYVWLSWERDQPVVNSADRSGPGQVLDIYLNQTFSTTASPLEYALEHVWPKIFGFEKRTSLHENHTRSQSSYPHTDAHHLFAADLGYNSSRINKPFDWCSGCSEKATVQPNNPNALPQGVYPGLSNWTTGLRENGRWETWSDRRGDVARAIFYLDIRYEGDVGTVSHFEPNLKLTNDQAQIVRCKLPSNPGFNSETSYMGILDTLLLWNSQDPPDQREVDRNNAVERVQRNRNPFIDDHTYANCLYSGQCDGGTFNITQLPAVTGLQAIDNGNQVLLAWNASPDARVVGYHVYRGTYNSTCPDRLIADITSAGTTTFNDGGITPGTTYYYGVTAYSAIRTESDLPPTTPSVTPSGTVIPPPPAPGNLSASSGNGQVTLGWDVAPGADTYTVYRVEIGDASGTVLYEELVSGLATNGYLDTAVINGRTYFYRVTAVDAEGRESELSVEVRAMPTSEDRPPPTPSNLVAVPTTGAIDISWIVILDSPPDVSHYAIYRSDGAESPFVLLASTPDLAFSYQDTAVTDGVVYTYLVRAVDDAGQESGDSNLATATPTLPHSGSSPWFEPPDDYRFVRDVGGGLDTGCSYADLYIDLPVSRYFGHTVGGRIDPALVEAGHVAPTAYLVLPALDIDTPFEVDNVYLNGQLVGRLEGANNTWAYNVLEVPIDAINLPTEPGKEQVLFGERWGVPPTPASNQIRIDVDVLGGGNDWCMSVDWVALYIDGIYPILFVHGFGSGEDAWEESGARARLEELGIPFRTDINLPNPFGSIQGNGQALDAIVRETMTSFGTRRFHLTTHSKGGLDSRSMISDSLPRTNAASPDNAVQPLSLHTLSTPHHGTVLTVLADIGLDAAVDGVSGAASLISADPLTAALFQSIAAQITSGTPELSPENMDGNFNPSHPIPEGLYFHSMGADAVTRPGDDWVKCPEGETLIGNYLPDLPVINNPWWAVGWLANLTPRCLATTMAGTALYRANGYLTQVEVEVTDGSGTREWQLVNVGSQGPIENDLVISVPSSRLADEPYWLRNENLDITQPEDALDHSAIKDREMVDWVLENLQQVFPRGAEPFGSTLQP